MNVLYQLLKALIYLEKFYLIRAISFEIKNKYLKKSK